MQLEDKLAILADSAKYDVACTSSGVDRAGVHGKLGCSVAAGICHSFTPDGRCISLLKVLYSNACCYDCGYCVNRRSNDVPRATFTPRELAELTIGFYKRNYIEGLFLSSAVIGTPDYTMERMIEALRCVPGVTVFPSDSNWVLLRIDEAAAAWQFLFDRGVLVRDFSAAPLLESTLRVTVGTP